MKRQLNLVRDVFKLVKDASPDLVPSQKRARDAAERRKGGCANDSDS
jgi:hypothetical protein